MLNNAREGEKIGLEGDVYDQVAHACRGARPRIQKWIEEDTGEREGVMDRLLLCNDLINNALERFEACKAGDWGRAQAIVDRYVFYSCLCSVADWETFGRHGMRRRRKSERREKVEGGRGKGVDKGDKTVEAICGIQDSAGLRSPYRSGVARLGEICMAKDAGRNGDGHVSGVDITRPGQKEPCPMYHDQ